MVGGVGGTGLITLQGDLGGQDLVDQGRGEGQFGQVGRAVGAGERAARVTFSVRGDDGVGVVAGLGTAGGLLLGCKVARGRRVVVCSLVALVGGPVWRLGIRAGLGRDVGSVDRRAGWRLEGAASAQCQQAQGEGEPVAEGAACQGGHGRGMGGQAG